MLDDLMDGNVCQNKSSVDLKNNLKSTCTQGHVKGFSSGTFLAYTEVSDVGVTSIFP